jgi:hypothetical protein
MKKSRVVPQQVEDDDMTDVEVLGRKPLISEKLWVEKYQPKGYRDLLSDEVIIFYNVNVFLLTIHLLVEYKQDCPALAENVGSHRFQYKDSRKKDCSKP